MLGRRRIRHAVGAAAPSLSCVDCAVPVGRLEAVPDVRAQEGLVQGQGLRCCAQAIAAGLQPRCGGAGGGPGGSPVDVCVAGIGRSGWVLFRSRGRRTVRVHMRCMGHWGMSGADCGDQGVG